MWLHNMYIWLGFSPEAAKLLITDKNVYDICNVMRKLGSKNANGMHDRRQQVSVIAQENLKLVTFLYIIGGDAS